MGVEVSIFLSTKDRSASLRRTLASIDACDRFGIDLDVVCVDNGSTDDTPQVIADFSERLNITALYQREAGLSEALNLGLAHIAVKHQKNRLVIRTDDDVVVSEQWLQTYANAARNDTDRKQFFGGRVNPQFSQATKLAQHIVERWPELSAPLFAKYDWPDGRIGALPFGLNMGFHLDHGRGVQFKKHLSFPYSMGEETDYLLYLREQGLEASYLHDASLVHCIRPEQVKLAWMQKRMHSYGISDAQITYLHRKNKCPQKLKSLRVKIRNYHLRRRLKPKSPLESQARELRYIWHTAKFEELSRLLGEVSSIEPLS
ncbi:MAG: glycosyltransferase [Nevskiales bacterium]